MTPFHAAVWLDHDQAKIFHLEEKRFDESMIKAPSSHVRRDPAANEQFLHAVAKALETAGEVLVVGPGTAKLELLKHVQKHHRALGDKIVGVETVDHPTDNQLVTYARKYFQAEDRMRGIGVR
ncbi:MAG: translational machinery protein [Deltaproteobacteria bacterium]|nr:translational machinery protein [Deltaproteobacteria bacterium]